MDSAAVQALLGVVVLAVLNSLAARYSKKALWLMLGVTFPLYALSVWQSIFARKPLTFEIVGLAFVAAICGAIGAALASEAFSRKRPPSLPVRPLFESDSPADRIMRFRSWRERAANLRRACPDPYERHIGQATGQLHQELAEYLRNAPDLAKRIANVLQPAQVTVGPEFMRGGTMDLESARSAQVLDSIASELNFLIAAQREPATTQEPPDRHLDEVAAKALVTALGSSEEHVVVATFKQRPERQTFGGEIARAFRRAGWTVHEHLSVDVPPSHIDVPDFDDFGVVLMELAQDYPDHLGTILKRRMALAEAALQAAGVWTATTSNRVPRHIGFYTDKADTSMPVVFIGARVRPFRP